MQIQSVKVTNAVITGDSGIDYSITVNGDGAAVCSCPSYKYGNHACKHIMFLYNNLLSKGV